MTIIWLRAETMMRIKIGINWTNRARPPCSEGKTQTKMLSPLQYIGCYKKKKQTVLQFTVTCNLHLSVVLVFLAYYDVQSAFFRFCKHVHYL